MAHDQLEIQGMTCTACAAAVERAVGKLPGVESAAVNFAVEKLDIRFDDTVTGIPEIISTVESAGYGATEPDLYREITLPISGMITLYLLRIGFSMATSMERRSPMAAAITGRPR